MHVSTFASIVIPTCDRPAALAECLEHVRRSIARCGRADVQIVVTDDGATLAAESLRERFPEVVWHRGPRRGPAANRNAGVGVANGRWILFTDDDCLPSPAWISAFLEAIRTRPDVRVFEGATTIDRPFARLDEEAPWNEDGGYLWACNMAIERALFVALGGFCEQFPAAASEDSDFKLRIEKARHAIVFVRQASVCHPVRPVRGLRHQFKLGHSYLLLARRHPEVLGPAPWNAVVLNACRMLVAVLRTGARMRYRGFTYALGRIAIHSGFNVVAIVRRSSSA